MTSYRLSRQARADLDEIFDFTIEKFGLIQARRYSDSLLATVETLSANPRMGRLAPALGDLVRRHEHKSHVIIYREEAGGIVVLLIVHGRRLLGK